MLHWSLDVDPHCIVCNRDTALRPRARLAIAAHSLSSSAQNRYHPCLSAKDRGGKEWRCTTPSSMSHLTGHVVRLHSAVDFSHCRLSGLVDGPQLAPLPYLQFSQQTAGSCTISIPVFGPVLHVTVRSMVLPFTAVYLSKAALPLRETTHTGCSRVLQAWVCSIKVKR